MTDERSTIPGGSCELVATRRRGAALAAAAAALFLAGCGKEQPATTPPGGEDETSAVSGSEAGTPAEVTDDEAEVAEVKCLGINECSGQSACDVAGSHDCGGQNSCKGKGWILASQADCDARGGKVL